MPAQSLTRTDIGTIETSDGGITIKASGEELRAWATRPGYAWPCSTLAELDSATIDLAPNGDLAALEAIKDGSWRVEGSPIDIPGDELTAYVQSVQREEIIAQAIETDRETFEAEACATRPGRNEGADDLALVVALDILAGNGFADEVAGDVETYGHGQRFGPFVLFNDSQGFVSVDTYDNADRAHDALMTLEPSSIADLAGEAVGCFELRERQPEGPTAEAFVSLKDGSPEWIKEAIRAAHDGKLPDDCAYRVSLEAFETIKDQPDADLDDLRTEFADSVDVYTHDLTTWLDSHSARMGYCLQAQEEGLVDADADVAQRIAAGQYVERGLIFDAIRSALEEIGGQS